MKTLASVDIGSNGARLLIKTFEPNAEKGVVIRKVMYLRIPLRLGEDVFTIGKISKGRRTKMKHMLKAFRQLMHLYHVDDYRACATAAMRDASNGDKVINSTRKQTGIRLDIIKGKEEALLLRNNIVGHPDYQHGNFAFIDVGGGSTEVSIISDGQLISSHSYNVGTLRMLSGKVEKEYWDQIRAELAGHAQGIDQLTIIGSGGNINKLYKLTAKKADTRRMTISDLRKIYARLTAMTLEQRMDTYGLRADRADVIVPAAEIFLMAAEALACQEIEVPNISLADSIVDGLYNDKYTATAAGKTK